MKADLLKSDPGRADGDSAGRDVDRLLPPEIRLVLQSAAGTPPAPEFAALAASDLDWEVVTALAERVGASAVLGDILETVRTTAPAEQRNHLIRVAAIRRLRQELLQRKLEQTVRVLDDAGIPVLLLKGAGLALTVYGSFGDRLMSDLDLLVPDERSDEAYDLLTRDDWIPQGPRERYRHHHHLPPLQHVGGSRIRLELHTRLLPPGHPFRLDEGGFRERARALEVAGSRVAVPGLEDQALHLCMHFAWSHTMRFSAWSTFRDLRKLDEAGLHWDELVRTARRARAASTCYWTLRLGRSLTHHPVPSGVLEALRPPTSRVSLDLLERHLALQVLPTNRACPSIALGRALWVAAIRPGQSGHGASRPWDLSPVAERTSSPRVAAVHRHLGVLRHWGRYAAAIAGRSG